LTPEELEAEETAEIEAVTATAEAESPRDATAEALWRAGEQLRFPVAQLRGFGSCWPSLLPLSLHSRPVDLEATRERLDRRQETLLQADDEQPRGCLRPARGAGEALLARRAVLVEETGQQQLGCVVGKSVKYEAHDVALRKSALDLADVVLEPAHHHVFQRPLAPHLDAARKPIGIEQL
jgi:hypothetical protein